MFRRLALVVTLLAGAYPAHAAEEAHQHETAVHQTIAVGRDRIVPTALTMSASDVLVIENFSPYPKTIRFISPENQVDKVRCGLLEPGAAKGEGELALFRWDDKNRLVATIAPGRFGSLCSFAPGEYAYVVEPAVAVPGGSSAAQALRPKGTITVK